MPKRPLTFTAVGDAIVTQRFSPYEEGRFKQLIDTIREQDVSFVNLEVLLHDYEGYPAAQSGGTYMRAPPAVADELDWSGFNLFSAATNHAGDFSHGGMEATMRALEERDLRYAGLGENLADARSPTYLDTPSGRVALISCCTTITTGSEAGAQRPDMKGRPGISPLELRTRYVVSEETHDQVAQISEKIGLEDLKERKRKLGFSVPGEDEDGLTLINVGGDTDVQFQVGDEPGIKREVNESSAEEIKKQIHAANRQADWVFVSLHAHEGRDGRFNDDSVPDFLETFARGCIDSGADGFVGHGPHVLRGIEVYQGAPIFYSLGNFFMQNETVSRLPTEIYERYDLDTHESLPADLFDERVFDEDGQPEGFLSDRRFWESVLPVCEFDDDGVASIDLYPLDLGHQRSRPQRGRPMLAEPEAAARILDDLESLSSPYETRIMRDGETASVKL